MKLSWLCPVGCLSLAESPNIYVPIIFSKKYFLNGSHLWRTFVKIVFLFKLKLVVQGLYVNCTTHRNSCQYPFMNYLTICSAVVAALCCMIDPIENQLTWASLGETHCAFKHCIGWTIGRNSFKSALWSFLCLRIIKTILWKSRCIKITVRMLL